MYSFNARAPFRDELYQRTFEFRYTSCSVGSLCSFFKISWYQGFDDTLQETQESNLFQNILEVSEVFKQRS